MPTAFITGISGQDGSYLSEHLLAKGWKVCGMVRRHSIAETQDQRLAHIDKHVQTCYGDMTCAQSIRDGLRRFKPDWVFNLAAQSHVRVSFDLPSYTFDTNAVGVLNLLEAVRSECPWAHVYHASSSEMFGNNLDADKRQRITTPMDPTSPYGCAKLAAFKLVRHYRRAYKIFAVNGILFNHTSPRRGVAFVEAKIARAAAMIAAGKEHELRLGNIDTSRDWGHSKDYTRAMILMLEQKEARDYLIATGESHTVREICHICFARLGLDYKKFVVEDEALKRPEELRFLCGDSEPYRKVLGWNPLYTFRSMMDEISEHWKQQVGIVNNRWR